ncbi:MAG TPA: rRNA maturation RNase YbeY [Epsilonproteobacteria bacterium]|nr:rRNA maturation RNase YbeY [Campylobacterota bacterium]
MITIDNQIDFDFDTKLIETIASHLSIHEIEVVLTNNETICNLNKVHRGKDYPTDVLSFPLETPMAHMPLGSIVISIDFATSQAKEHGHSIDDEIALLFLHGMLHLLGFDHEKDNGEMASKEEELATFFQLQKTLIQRTKGED